MTQTYQTATLIDLIGNTPLVPLLSLSTADMHVFAKLETYNPGGSLYDRLALSRLQRARKSGRLTEKAPVIEATASEVTVSLAMLGAMLGHPIHCVVDRTCPRTRVQLLTAYGAILHWVNHPSERARLAMVLQVENPRLFLFDGSDLPEETASPLVDELISELGHAPDLLLLPASFAEGASACAAQLNAVHTNAHVVAVSLLDEESQQAPAPHGLHEHLRIPLEASLLHCQQLLQSESLLAGPETGATVEALRHAAGNILPPNERPLRVVLIVADHGDRHLSLLKTPADEKEA